MICQQCKSEDKKSNVYPSPYSVTTAMCSNDYYDSDGKYHSHNTNVRTQTYSCSNGHNWSEKSSVNCWCGWGKE